MKRIISMLLTITLLFSCGIIATSAADSKLTPELQQTVAELREGDTVDIVVYFADKTLRINEMPGWNSSDQVSLHNASTAHAEYLVDRNYALIREIFAPCENYQTYSRPTTGRTYYMNVDYTMEGCCIARNLDPAYLDAICANPHVRSIDLCPVWSADSKYEPSLIAVLNAVDPDDWIEVGVHRAGSIKTVADMPSWPAGKGSLEETHQKIAAARDEYAAYIAKIEAAFFAEAFEDVDVRYMVTGLGGMTFVAVRAGDVATIASRGCVRDIEYFYNAIPENESTGTPYDKIDTKLLQKLEETKNVSATLRVCIALNINPLTLRKMPSYPDVAKAEQEFHQYQRDSLNPQYKEALGALNAVTQLEGVRCICYDALVAMVPNQLSDIYALAENDWVKSIRYFVSDDEWETDHQRYDFKNISTRYRDRFISQYDYFDCNMYQELFYHDYAPDDKTYGYDWALVEASNTCIVSDVCHYEIVGGRLLYAGGYRQQPFTFDIGLYDAEQDRFFDVTEIDFDDYPDLYEVWQQLDLGFCTNQEFVGDADGDRDVTILDATKIQRGIAGLDSKYSIVATGADTDGDGEMTVLDATRIQRYKADLCNLDGSAVAQ